MKNAAIITLGFFTLLFLMPFAWDRLVPAAVTNAYREYPAPESFKLLLTESGDVIEITPVDYLTGCLFAQIPPGYHIEALKAQAVAAHTYALRLSQNNKDFSSDISLKNADFSDSSVTCQPFYTEKKAREYFDAEYDIHLDKIRQAAEYGASRVILYNSQPIYSVYHSVSAGATNTALHVWGVDFPYLRSVPSEWDRGFANFICTNEITVNNMRSLLLEYDPNIIMPLDFSQWFSESVVAANGYVMTVSARNSVISGGDLWRLLNLRSVAFDIKYTGGVFTVTTRGHGHGAGLSQFGADYMARRGYSADDILNYYYTDVVIAEF